MGEIILVLFSMHVYHKDGTDIFVKGIKIANM